MPPGKLSEGFSPGRAFPWIPPKIEFGQFSAGCTTCEGTAGLLARMKTMALSLKVPTLAHSPLTPKCLNVFDGERATEKCLVCTLVEAWQPSGMPPGNSIWWSSKRVTLGGDAVVDLRLF